MDGTSGYPDLGLQPNLGMQYGVYDGQDQPSIHHNNHITNQKLYRKLDHIDSGEFGDIDADWLGTFVDFAICE